MTPPRTIEDLVHTLTRSVFAVYMLLVSAEARGAVPVSAGYLEKLLKCSANTVTDALRELCSPERNLAVRVRGGWRLASPASQLALFAFSPGDRAQGEILTADENCDTGENIARDGNERLSHRKNLTERENSSLYDDVVVGINSNRDSSSPELNRTTNRTRTTTLTDTGNRVSTINRAQREIRLGVVHGFGVWSPTADTLVELEWATPAYLHAHLAYAHAEGCWNNPNGKAIIRILAHEPAPENSLAAAVENRRP